MLGVSEKRPNIKQTEFRPPYLGKSLAFHEVGIGRDWSTPLIVASITIPSSSH